MARPYKSLYKRIDDTYFYEVDVDAVEGFSQEVFIANAGNRRERGRGYHSDLMVKVVVGFDIGSIHYSYWKKKDGTYSANEITYANLIASLNYLGFDPLGGIRGDKLKKYFRDEIVRLVKEQEKYKKYNAPIFKSGVKKLATKIRNLGRDYIRGSYSGEDKKPDLSDKTIEIRTEKAETNNGLYGGVRGIYEPLYESGLMEGELRVLDISVTGRLYNPPVRSHHKNARRIEPKTKSAFDKFLDDNVKFAKKHGDSVGAMEDLVRDVMSDKVRQASDFAKALTSRIIFVDKLGFYKIKTPSGVAIKSIPRFSSKEEDWRNVAVENYKSVMRYMMNKSGYHPRYERRERGGTAEGLRQVLVEVEKEYPEMFAAFSAASRMIQLFGIKGSELMDDFRPSKFQPKD
jgi:hypothetical protein